MSIPRRDQPLEPRRSARIRRQRLASSGQSETREQKRKQTRAEYLQQVHDGKSGSMDKERPLLAPIVGEPVFRDPRKMQNESQRAKQTESGESKASEREQVEVPTRNIEGTSEPWETLVIGAHLGDNLSKIEYKDREILQQKFIVEWTTRCEPNSTEAQQQLLEELQTTVNDQQEEIKTLRKAADVVSLNSSTGSVSDRPSRHEVIEKREEIAGLK